MAQRYAELIGLDAQGAEGNYADDDIELHVLGCRLTF